MDESTPDGSEARAEGNRWTLVFVRELPHPPQRVWRALSETAPASVRRADPPVLLEYTWDADVLRWELEPTASGTRLTLRHTVEDKTWIARVAAGWHICLDVADHMMAGRPLGRIVADAAKKHGWEQLNAAYSAQLGIANAGGPEKAG